MSRFVLLALTSALCLLASASAQPTLWVIGDSTVRNGSGAGANGQWGWGEPLSGMIDASKLRVVNRALGGRSTRTFISGGNWERVLAELKPGDFVIMQFGHNDASPVNDNSRARGTLHGTGDETQDIDNLLTRQHETVHTYGWYLRKFIREAKEKGALPIVCSLIPRNNWKGGAVVRSGDSWAGWAAEVAKAEAVPFIDLNARVADRYDDLGAEHVQRLFHGDHTHTSRAGAELNARVVGEALQRVPGIPAGAFQPGRDLSALEWRFIGPWRGGRSVSAVGIKGQPETYFFGAVGGGIWKSTNGGTSWQPLFDEAPVASIGAIAAAPSDPRVLYAGTGETDIRSNLAAGDGVYKSTDGGATWVNVGLRETRHIGDVLIHPANPEQVYVAALGHAYGPNPERGVYRTRDGGRNWQKVLDRGPETGAVELAMDPADPNVIYAAMWNAHRPPWSQYGPVEGPGSGLFQSRDGGDTWTQLAGNGLPDGDWGRPAVACGRGRVYLRVDVKGGAGMYRSDDAGRTWTRTSDDSRITSRSWYFGRITVDPNNAEHVLVPNVALYESTDGGKTFRVLKGAPGGDDYHSVWVDQANSQRMILASDQGVSVSVDGGVTWSPWYNQPTAQIYHVATDNRFPYSVYGAQQDSGTVAMPSRTNTGVISEYDRRTVGGAESGYILPDPRDPDIVYVNNTYGSLARFDRRTGTSQDITPWPGGAFGSDINSRKYRFTWTAPLAFSPKEPGALYYGSQFLLKTVDGGLTWKEVSPDLTGDTRTSGAPARSPLDVENARERGYGVIYTIAPSPLNAGLIWAGSDTGLVHVTRDGGKSWSNVTPKGLSAWSKITQIEASHFDAGTAYAAVDRHRLDDYGPHLYRTSDFGKTWTPITGGMAPRAFLNSIREDPAKRGLLFAATEQTVYVSFDEGAMWRPLQLNLPVVSVRDIVVHEDDLVIATHGRGFWILDNMTPLRESATAAHLYKPARAFRVVNPGFVGTPLPPETPQAPNPPDGAVLDYELPATADVTLEILDASGSVVSAFRSTDRPEARRPPGAIADLWIRPPRRLTGHAGLNRFVWDLRYTATDTAVQGPLVMPGRYRVRLTADGKSLEQPLEVLPDPRSKATPADFAAQNDVAMRAWRGLLLARERKAPAMVIRDFSTVLSLCGSADRRPPAVAYTILERGLSALK